MLLKIVKITRKIVWSRTKVTKRSNKNKREIKELKTRIEVMRNGDKGNQI